jgi:hypothetical protein
MNTIRSVILRLAAMAALLAPLGAQALPFTFTFGLQPPGGVISGAPGQLIGWGYTLTNTDSVNWFVPTQLSASSFSLGAPDAGYFDFPILGPGLGASTAFDPVAGAGLFGLQLHAADLPGQSESGQFTLGGEWWSGDPLAGGMFLQASDRALAPFTVQVAGAGVPEPATLPLLAGAGSVWLALRRRRRGKP